MLTKSRFIRVNWFVSGNRTGPAHYTIISREEYEAAKTLKEKDDLIVKRVQKDFENKVGWTIISIED